MFAPEWKKRMVFLCSKVCRISFDSRLRAALAAGADRPAVLLTVSQPRTQRLNKPSNNASMRR